MKVFTNKKKMRGYREFLYILPFIILVAIFAYYPLYGWAYAFFDYKPPKALSMDDFVGLKWFRYLVDNPVRIKQTLMVLRNTFAMSGLTILFSWLPMIFAVFLNEIKCMPFRKFVQTVTTLPNFISWVLVFSICYCMFNSTGMANSLLIQMGVLEKPIAFLQSSNHIWLKMWLWSTWKSLGWSAIMYIAAISGIDAELYEAAKVDGAGEWKCFTKITLPNLLPSLFTIVVLSVLNAFKVFREAYLVAGDYPQEKMYLLQHLFNNWYRDLSLDKMSAAAVVTGLVIFLLILGLWKAWGKGGAE